MSGSIEQNIEGNGNTQIGSATYILPEPLQVFEGDLRDLIVSFRKVVPSGPKNQSDYLFEGIEDKNAKNQMNSDYFKTIIEGDLPFFLDIDEFLGDPRFSQYSDMYDNTALDLQGQFLANRDKFVTIDQFLAYSHNTIFKSLHAEIRKDRGKIRTFLHHMYWKCSIGVR